MGPTSSKTGPSVGIGKVILRLPLDIFDVGGWCLYLCDMHQSYCSKQIIL